MQPSPDGFIIGEDFIDDTVAMVLGGNIFAGHGLDMKFKETIENAENGKVISIEEKPIKPKSNYCVTGLHFYDNKVVVHTKNDRLSA